jgi:hypothetical protein
MHSINELANQADHVTLYVFDQQEILVLKNSCEESEITNDYCVRLNSLNSGKYKFVAWAKSKKVDTNEEDFAIPELIEGSSRLDELTYYLNRTDGKHQCELDNLLVGMTEANIIDTKETQTVNIEMKKVNSKIRVVLLPYDGGNDLDVNNYSFKIIDQKGNGHINYDFNLIDDESITYHPYYTANSEPASSETIKNRVFNKAAIAELNMSRIIESNNPKLIISSTENEQEIVNINLPWFFSLTGMESHKDWTAQEYLDRQDEYAITFFLLGNSWMQSTIIINGWVINNIEID